jgi:hypothetical protein
VTPPPFVLARVARGDARPRGGVAYRVAPDDIDELRGHGLTDTEIFEVALAASARAFFSKSLDSMGAEPDDALADSARLFDLVELRHSAE